jgi:hypothetical protein
MAVDGGIILVVNQITAQNEAILVNERSMNREI